MFRFALLVWNARTVDLLISVPFAIFTSVTPSSDCKPSGPANFLDFSARATSLLDHLDTVGQPSVSTYSHCVARAWGEAFRDRKLNAVSISPDRSW